MSPSSDVNITGFSGDMVSQSICTPTQQGSGLDVSWQGEVQTRGGIGEYPYTIALTIDGRPMSFSPYIKVV